jgi:large subunit ribosomal protein L17
MANRKLGRTSGHRAALFRNQLASMIQSERIVTTLVKAKELRPIVEKAVTLGKNDTVHARRQAARIILDNGLIAKLFSTISPRFATTPGGYTRIIKIGPRRGDGAEMAILQFTDYKLADSDASTSATPAKKAAPAADAKPKKGAKADADTSATTEEKPKRSRKKPEAAE